ncbi:tetratricopeptide repeat protein [Hirschia maritima]|uniref:tetratricopeptide repeat protein n=1 Tax=Hirschia maritima TaxID=1121961 RepID=UPI00036EB69B|nr:tetratricopeptide repeat protein [Hirschia maritima]
MTENAPQIGQIEGAVGNIMASKAIEEASNLSVNAASPKKKKLKKHCRKAAQLIQQNKFIEAQKEALAALDIDETSPLANHVAAIALDRMDKFELALQFYNRAIKYEPNNAELYRNTGLLCWRMNKLDAAETFFRLESQIAPDCWQPKNNLGNVLRDKGELDSSIELLRTALYQHPEQSELWSAIGSTAIFQLQTEEAIQFHTEAVRLAPSSGRAHHNLGFTHLTDGNCNEAVAHFDNALKYHDEGSFSQIATLNARSNALLAIGDLEKGWKEYEIRQHKHAPDFLDFLIPLPHWKDEDLKGKKLLLVGEQGLGDEVLFSSMLNDVLELIGNDGTLGVAIEPRLIPLFERSFPKIDFYGHKTGTVEGIKKRVILNQEDIKHFDFWAPLGAPLKHIRTDLSQFAQPIEGFLKPDPERVAYWKAELEKLPSGPKTGLVWKSAVMDIKRGRNFAGFDAWRPILQTPGITWINLQYGDAANDLKFAKEKLGVNIHTLEGIDLKQDLDDITALCQALDLVVGPMNATTNLAAAAGAPFWLLWPQNAWTKLGTDQMPWYPNTKMYCPKALNNWTPAINSLAHDLEAEVQNLNKEKAA